MSTSTSSNTTSTSTSYRASAESGISSGAVWHARYSTLLLIAKEPVAGQVKTRLATAVGFDGAAEVARACLWHTFAAAAEIVVDRRVVALRGEDGPWLPADWRIVEQCPGGLDRRLGDAFAQVARDGPAFLVGMDTPQLTADLLTRYDPARYDACLGPTEDGGFWGIGFADPTRAASVIHDVPMSVSTTYEEQFRRLTLVGLSVQVLPTLTDVDTWDDAVLVAGRLPDSPFQRSVLAHAATVIG